MDFLDNEDIESDYGTAITPNKIYLMPKGETREKQLQEFYGGAKKGDWDVGIVIDGIRASASADVIILVSGDGDFIPFIQYLKNQGKRVEVIAYGRSTSGKVKEEADEFIDLENKFEKYLLKKPQ